MTTSINVVHQTDAHLVSSPRAAGETAPMIIPAAAANIAISTTRVTQVAMPDTGDLDVWGRHEGVDIPRSEPVYYPPFECCKPRDDGPCCGCKCCECEGCHQCTNDMCGCCKHYCCDVFSGPEEDVDPCCAGDNCCREKCLFCHTTPTKCVPRKIIWSIAVLLVFLLGCVAGPALFAIGQTVFGLIAVVVGVILFVLILWATCTTKAGRRYIPFLSKDVVLHHTVVA
eukprot:gnl/Hemi2/22317_TR7420_c0_g1_i1.p1 gnl/Hemi2/22317_TR7420_c0_g1~~gnl/Hemi2/22317_TR7420_c0_g1_i1.p1  ORF type:complete len:227 (+),score=18.27 gnl/Hemi2/22317_TR7420_c0_g1_i1:118-798(+)